MARPHQYRFIGAFGLVASGMLLVLAAQNLPARLMALSGDGLREKVLSGDAFSVADFNAFTHSRESAVKWHPTAEYLGELSVAYAARGAQDGVDAGEGDSLYQKSLDSQRQALRIEAADTYGWSQLAFLDMQGGENQAQAAADLRLSIETAPYEPNLLLSRLDMLEGLNASLDPETKQAIPAVAREAWAWNANAVLEQAHNHDYLDAIAGALSDDPQKAQRFQDMMKQAGYDKPAESPDPTSR